MNNMLGSLEKYKKDIYSQNGEDGVIEYLLKELNINNGFFVDVGAWDGKYLSNTYHLLELGWGGLDIEANRNHFVGLIKVANIFPKLQIMLREVTPYEIDNLLDMYNVPEEFDLLNIDIDCYDYWVWDSMKKYKPKIVIIECNGMLDYDYVQPPKVGYPGKKGSSKSSLIKLGESKGYKFVGMVGNLFFVREDLL